MFKFLFGGKAGKPKVPETQRQVFERLTKDLAEFIADLPEKPVVTIDPNSGLLTFEAPGQFPDEALALPAPEPEPAPEVEDTKDATPVEEKAA